MRLEVVEDANAVAERAAALVADLVEARPALALAPATGNSPTGLYERLAARRRDGLDTTRLRAFQLDEYAGVAPDAPQSLWGWMARGFLEPLGVRDARGFDARADDLDRECARHDEAIAVAGGLDLAILGLGPNGHLGFNEPPSAADAPTRRVRLSPQSLESNTAYWNGASVPREALTLGMKPLLAARHILLIVHGEAKRDALRAAVEGPVTDDLPASHLQRTDAVVLADRAAWGSGR